MDLDGWRLRRKEEKTKRLEVEDECAEMRQGEDVDRLEVEDECAEMRQEEDVDRLEVDRKSVV